MLIMIDSLINRQLSNGCPKNSSCYDTEEVSDSNFAHGVSALVCFLIFLLPTLVLEIYYLRRYRSTFLQRLFYYLTISCMILTFSHIQLLILYFYPILVYCYFIDATISYAVLTELMLILSINIILLFKLYKYSLKKQGIPTTRCNCNQKMCEFVFLLCHFGIPLVASTVQLVTTTGLVDETGYCRSLTAWHCLKNSTNFIVESICFVYFPVGLNILLSIVVLSSLIIWLIFSLKRINLMKHRLLVVCREMGLFVGFLFFFAIFWIVSASIAFFQNTIIAAAALFPISNSVLLVSFAVYICLTLRKDHTIGPGKANATTVYATIPPSTRVSLPTDTADHAPNFLSPSTAESTEISLLIN